MEYHLVMMNLLINQHFKPLVEYKYNLFYYILDHSDFNIEIYCLVRHLLTFKMNQLNQVILGMTHYKMMSDEQMHYQASLILLLEKQYKQAYFHLPFVTIDESFKRFENLFIIIHHIVMKCCIIKTRHIHLNMQDRRKLWTDSITHILLLKNH